MTNTGPGRLRGKGLSDALFTRTQQRVLGRLFGQPGRSFDASDVVRGSQQRVTTPSGVRCAA